MKRRLFLALPLALTPVAARACINDRDSDALAVEAKRFPDLVSVITGRFERNPPRYYQMRAERVEKELAADPTKLALYDDLAAALDRLHRDDEAVAWMERKKAQLEKVAPHESLKSPEHKEAWYRYHANVGTFLVHAWIRRPGHEDHPADLKRARAHIARAIEIKPDAHFGRERYQLLAMDWLLRDDAEDFAHIVDDSLTERLKAFADNWAGRDRQHKAWRAEAVQGLSGLIVLGAAWESPDIFQALEWQLASQHHGKLAYLTRLRLREFLAAGRHSALWARIKDASNGRGEEAVVFHPPWGERITGERTVETKYRELRAEAERWHAARIAYMDTRFDRGLHPDTDPTFWNDWRPAPPPSLAVSWFADAGENFGNKLTVFLNPEVFVPLGIPALVLFLLLRALYRRLRA